jgi:NAD(P)-dependent dehydrogenase (short-subunit alcohol dehydrogenase family)
LHARGANIVLVGRDLSAVTVLAHELGDRRALPLSVDVTDPAALRNAGIRAVDRFGALYVVFANAGVAPKAPATIAGIDPELFEHTVEVDLLGVWRTVRAALPQVIAHRGHVLVTASIYAYVNGAVNAPYAVSKAAVEQFARALRVELAMHQATAGILYPGWVHTPMTTSSPECAPPPSPALSLPPSPRRRSPAAWSVASSDVRPASPLLAAGNRSGCCAAWSIRSSIAP